MIEQLTGDFVPVYHQLSLVYFFPDQSNNRFTGRPS
jgi:hypothetical protein